MLLIIEVVFVTTSPNLFPFLVKDHTFLPFCGFSVLFRAHPTGIKRNIDVWYIQLVKI